MAQAHNSLLSWQYDTLKKGGENPINDTQQIDVARFWNCVICEVKDAPEKDQRYTREEFLAHLNAAHPGYALCKGCEELLSKGQYETGKGWCEMCVILCYDCVDEEKYGSDALQPVELDFTDGGDWLMPKVYKGYNPQPSLMERIVSGIRAVQGLFR